MEGAGIGRGLAAGPAAAIYRDQQYIHTVVGSQALPGCRRRSSSRWVSGGVAGAKPRGAIVASRSACVIAEIRPD